MRSATSTKPALLVPRVDFLARSGVPFAQRRVGACRSRLARV